MLYCSPTPPPDSSLKLPGHNQPLLLSGLIRKAPRHIYEVLVQGHSHVRRKSPRRGGPDHKTVGTFPRGPRGGPECRFRCLVQGKPNPDRGTHLFLIFDLCLCQGCMRPVGPLYRLLTLIDGPLLHQRGEDPDELGVSGLTGAGRALFMANGTLTEKDWKLQDLIVTLKTAARLVTWDIDGKLMVLANYQKVAHLVGVVVTSSADALGVSERYVPAEGSWST